jgi:hypothetical protein
MAGVLPPNRRGGKDRWPKKRQKKGKKRLAKLATKGKLLESSMHHENH